MLLQTQHILCPGGHPVTIDVPERLDVFGPADARSPLLEGRIARMTCPRCKRRLAIDEAVSYWDRVRRHFVRVVPWSERSRWLEAEAFQAALQPPGGPFAVGPARVRLVHGLDELREKLMLWDAGLDDRWVEVMKLEALESRDLELRRSERLHLLLEQIDLEGDRLVFLARRLTAPHRPERISIGLELYRSLQADPAVITGPYAQLFDASYVSALRFLPTGQS